MEVDVDAFVKTVCKFSETKNVISFKLSARQLKELSCTRMQQQLHLLLSKATNLPISCLFEVKMRLNSNNFPIIKLTKRRLDTVLDFVITDASTQLLCVVLLNTSFPGGVTEKNPCTVIVLSE